MPARFGRRSRVVGRTPRSIDEYLAGLRPDTRAALQTVRASIRAAAPRAEEGIAYGMPAFRLNGRWLVGFRAAARHCAFHPMSGVTVKAHRAELRGYDTSPGTIRFPASAPLPARLVRKLVKTRIAEIESRASGPAKKRAARPRR
jgi:uncharacterized protein YdhG (YjbR/CyaY superfamily)